MPSKPTRPGHSRKSSSFSRRSLHVEKTEVRIHVYDLLPPGRLSSLLWTVGGSLLHSGVVIKGREYAYGGHNKRNTTGVYWTRPKFEPPGGTFRCDILQGFTFRQQHEIDQIIKEVSEEFLGPSYNLLTHNCNHFTSALCERLTGRSAPAWLNRAASIGLALPCVVPRDWISPPDHDTADGELLDDETDGDDERSGMLESDRRRRHREEQGRLDDIDEQFGENLAGGRRLYRDHTPPPRLVAIKDSSGRDMPPAERAPLPKRSSTYS